MSSATKKTIRLSVTFPRRGRSGSALEELGRERDLQVNILRGRVSAERSSFELEVSGAAFRVARIFDVVAHWGATVSTAAAGVSYI